MQLNATLTEYHRDRESQFLDNPMRGDPYASINKTKCMVKTGAKAVDLATSIPGTSVNMPKPRLPLGTPENLKEASETADVLTELTSKAIEANKGDEKDQ